MHTFDAAYLHLLVNHIPIILTLVGAVAAILGLALRRRGLWLYAVASLTISGATAYPVMLTGHAAEDVMKDKWYVTHESIDEHEEAGETAMWVLIAMGAVSAYAWWRLLRRDPNQLPTWLGALVVLASLAGVGTTTIAAYRGGNIVYYSPKLASPPPR